MASNELVCCSICLENYREPRALPCLHSYCTICLQKLVTPQEKLRCPGCTVEYEVPGKDVSKFKKNFHLTNLCEMAACKNDPRNADPHCSKHAAYICELYCEDCSKMICYKCVAKGQSCHRHTYKDVEDVRQHLKSVVLTSSGTVNTINERLSRLENIEEKQDENYNELCATIRSQFQEISNDISLILRDRENSLLYEARKAHEKNLGVLSAERRDVELKRSDVMKENKLCEEISAMATSENSAVLAFMKNYEDFKGSQLPEFTLPDVSPQVSSCKMTFENDGDVLNILKDRIENYGSVRNDVLEDENDASQDEHNASPGTGEPRKESVSVSSRDIQALLAHIAAGKPTSQQLVYDPETGKLCVTHDPDLDNVVLTEMAKYGFALTPEDL